MAFQISPLRKANFEGLFALSDEQLVEQKAVRMIAEKKPGYPCRVSLEDAGAGEEVILIHHEHHAVESPFRASHAIYVRRNAREARLAADEWPDQLRSRTLSLRCFDANGMMVDADLADGRELGETLERLFENKLTDYIHIHFAKPGCYAALAKRA